MTALTPDCDPDLSRGGSGTRPPGSGLRSTLVLLALVTAAVLAVGGDAVPGAVAALAGGVGGVSALVLAARVARLARRAGAAVAARTPWTAAVHRSRPAG